ANCAQECEKHDGMQHCQQCAESCRRCEDACRKLLDAAGRLLRARCGRRRPPPAPRPDPVKRRRSIGRSDG
ncbi:MAG: four-helix bundle copper-binding protein, partial [Actinobacteria bacterium]|nr:four-helix bundle copper-binding protein [Actinomycetota bacterium]